VSDRPQPRSLRSLRKLILRRLLLGLLVFSAVAAAVLLATDALIDWEGIAIDAERSRRLHQAKLGQPLPGTPDVSDLPGRLAAQSLRLGAPIFIRIFKREFELELWLKREDRFERFAVYPICRWSGRLGPKLEEGDSQAPEGFYTVDAKALNPASRWHRSFNLGFPNAFDRAHNRTGSFVMVHGGCASVGCFAMTDPVVDEIWRLVTAALKGGQKRFHVHVFPFRMTEKNLDSRRHRQWAPFWADLKQGYDAFETVQVPPRIAVCAGRYTFERDPATSDGNHDIDSGCQTLTGSGG
jgi:murein L,D-transpeptidase YafK